MHTHNNTRTRIKKQGPTRTVSKKTLTKHGKPPIAPTDKVYLRQMSVMKPVIMLKVPRFLSYIAKKPEREDQDPERHYVSHYTGPIPYSTSSAGLDEAREAVRMGEMAMSRWKALKQQQQQQQQSSNRNQQDVPARSQSTPQTPPLDQNRRSYGTYQKVKKLRKDQLPEVAQLAVDEASSARFPIPTLRSVAAAEMEYPFNNAVDMRKKQLTTSVPNQHSPNAVSHQLRHFSSKPTTSQPPSGPNTHTPLPSTNFQSNTTQIDENAAPIRPTRPTSMPVTSSLFAQQYQPPSNQFSESDFDTDFSRTSHISSTRGDDIDHYRQNLRAKTTQNDSTRFTSPDATLSGQYERVAPFIDQYVPKTKSFTSGFINDPDQNAKGQQPPQITPKQTQPLSQAQPYAVPPTQAVQFDDHGKVVLQHQTHLQHEANHPINLQHVEPRHPTSSSSFSKSKPSYRSSEFTTPKPSKETPSYKQQPDLSYLDQFAPPSIRDSEQFRHANKLRSLNDIKQQANGKYNNFQPRTIGSLKTPDFSPQNRYKSPQHDDSLDSSRIKVHGDDYSLESSAYVPIPMVTEPTLEGVRRTFKPYSADKEFKLDAAKGQMYSDSNYQADGIHELSSRITDIIQEDLAAPVSTSKSQSERKSRTSSSLNDDLTKKSTSPTSRQPNVSSSFKSTPPTLFRPSTNDDNASVDVNINILDKPSQKSKVGTNFPPSTVPENDPISSGSRDKTRRREPPSSSSV